MSAGPYPHMVSHRMPEFPPFRLDNVNQCLWRQRDGGQDECMRLTPKPFAILRYLIEHAGRLVTQDELLNAVWPNTFVQPEVLKTHILDIRTALGDSAKHPRFIETLPRRGYQFIAMVRSTSAMAEPAFALSSHKLVGRDAELMQLQSCFWRAMGGQRQVVFITGEAGIGKTSLADEFLQQAATAVPNIRIARGSSIEGYGGKEAYYPVLEALAQMCRVHGGDMIARTLGIQAPTWLVQFPALVTAEQRKALQREILGATRERMLREICEALETISSDTPLVLILDDLHWADTSTVDLISALARRRRSANLMLICTYRTPDATLAHNPLRAVKQELLVHELCREVFLEPLTEVEVANYLANETEGAAAPPSLTALVYRHCEGNPLFMVAALEHMRDRGLIALENGTWKIKAALEKIHLEPPEHLREMIELQIEKLSAKEQEVLELASSKGKSFTADGAVVKRINQEEFENTCEALSRRQHIVRRRAPRKFADGSSRPCYEFIHSLYRDVFSQRQSLGQRPMLTIAASFPGCGSS
jgi:DNA-binding winged helix-turn-helix (wHTH) protein